MLSRKNSQLLALLLLLTLFAGLILGAVMQTPEANTVAIQSELEEEAMHDISDSSPPENSTDDNVQERPIVIDNFDRSFRKDGEIVWRATGERALVYTEKGEIKIINGNILTQTKNGEPIKIITGEAWLLLSGGQGAGGEIKEAHGKNGVEIISERGRMITDSAILDSISEKLSGTDPVKFLGDKMTTNGKGFTFYLNTNVLTVGGRVDTEFQ